MKELNWKMHEKGPRNTCICRCGANYRSHSKMVGNNGKVGMVSQDPCPQCGKTDDVCSASLARTVFLS